MHFHRFTVGAGEVYAIGQHVTADAAGRLHPYVAAALFGHGIVREVTGRSVVVGFLD